MTGCNSAAPWRCLIISAAILLTVLLRALQASSAEAAPSTRPEIISQRSQTSFTIVRGDTVELHVQAIESPAAVQWFDAGQVVCAAATCILSSEAWFPGRHQIFATVTTARGTESLSWTITVLSPPAGYQPARVEPALAASRPEERESTQVMQARALRGSMLIQRGEQPIVATQSPVPVLWQETVRLGASEVGMVSMPQIDTTYFLPQSVSVLATTDSGRRVIRLLAGGLRTRNFVDDFSRVVLTVGSWLNIDLGPHADMVLELAEHDEYRRAVITVLQGEVRIIFSLGEMTQFEAYQPRAIVIPAGVTVELVTGSDVATPESPDVRRMAEVVAMTTPGFQDSECVNSIAIRESFATVGGQKAGQGDFDRCAAWASTHGKEPNTFQDWLELARIRAGVFAFDGARRAYERASELAIDDFQAPFELGVMYMRLEQWELAQQWLAEAATRDAPDQALVAYYRGVAFSRQGLPASASHHLSLAASLAYDSDMGRSARMFMETIQEKKRLRLDFSLRGMRDSQPLPRYGRSTANEGRQPEAHAAVMQWDGQGQLRWSKGNGVNAQGTYSLQRREFREGIVDTRSETAHGLHIEGALVFGEKDAAPMAEIYAGVRAGAWLQDDVRVLERFGGDVGLRSFLWELTPELVLHRWQWRDLRPRHHEGISALGPVGRALADNSGVEQGARLGGVAWANHMGQLRVEYGYRVLQPAEGDEQRAESVVARLRVDTTSQSQLSWTASAERWLKDTSFLGDWLQHRWQWNYRLNLSFTGEIFAVREAWQGTSGSDFVRKQYGAGLSISL